MTIRIGFDRSQFGVGLHVSWAKRRLTVMLLWLFLAAEVGHAAGGNHT